MAWGSDPTALITSAGVTSSGAPVEPWGMGAAVELEPGTWALVLNHVHKGIMEIRTVDPSNPSELSAPVEQYTFPDVSQGTVILDESTDRWLMLYRDESAASYGLKIAPVHRE